MKLPLLLLLIICLTTAAAQQKIIPFGKAEKADFEITDCDFDKGAEALILLDIGDTHYDKGNIGNSVFKTVFERRIRLKILNTQGLIHANLRIPFYNYNNEERITKFNAYTYNIDSAKKIKTTAVGKNGFYIKRINKYYSELIIAFPEVKPGSILEYQYKMERETMGQVKDWFFQGSLPVKYSRYQITIPQIFRFTVQPFVIDNMEEESKVITERINTEKGVVQTQSVKTSYAMRNMPAIHNEPFMTCAKEYMQRLEFQLSQIDYGNGNIDDLRTKWSDVVEDLLEHDDFGKQLQQPIADVAVITKTAMTIPDTIQRIKYLFNTLRKKMRWNNEESIYTQYGIAKAWLLKKGNASDINLLLLKLLSDAGIEAKPVLFSTKDNGPVNIKLPSAEQFNTVMVFINASNVKLVLDAADTVSSIWLMPEKIANTRGFIVEGARGNWQTFFNGNSKYKITAAIQAQINDAGKINGMGLISSFDYAKKQHIEKWGSSSGTVRNFKLNHSGLSINIDEYEMTNANADSLPLEQKIKFSTALNSTNDYKYFTVNLFLGLDDNPFTAEDRISDIDFGFNQDYTLFGSYSIPDDYTFEVLPENALAIMPDTSIIFSRRMIAEGNLLNVRINIEFKKPYYAADLYPDFAAFYKKMFALLNEQVVIKKKTTP
jgi:hypothetical protein